MNRPILRDILARHEGRTAHEERHPESLKVLAAVARHLEVLRGSGRSTLPFMLTLHDLAEQEWWDVECELQRRRLEEEKGPG